MVDTRSAFLVYQDFIRWIHGLIFVSVELKRIDFVLSRYYRWLETSLVRKLKHVPLVRNVGHKEADATYSIIEMPDGELQLQIDTYGSIDRVDKTPGHRAQSIRLSSEAMQQLKKILAGIV